MSRSIFGEKLKELEGFVEQAEGTKVQLMKDHPDEFNAVRAILLEYWNPIDKRARPSVQYKFDSYVPQVMLFCMNGSSVSEIASYLVEIETKRMGVIHSTPQHWLRCKQGAEALVDYFKIRISAAGK
jgi:hypothetical protein